MSRVLFECEKCGAWMRPDCMLSDRNFFSDYRYPSYITIIHPATFEPIKKVNPCAGCGENWTARERPVDMDSDVRRWFDRMAPAGHADVRPVLEPML